MPIFYSLEGRLFRVRLEGAYSLDDIKQAFASALKDPSFDGISVMFIDETQSESLAKRTSEDLQRIARFIGAASNGRIRKCAVLVDTELKYGIGRMSQAFCSFEDFEMEIFRGREEAIEWLGVANPGLETA